MFSQKEERRITCPHCGKTVPAMVYCIYCGAKLPKVAPPEKVEAPPSKVTPPAPPPTVTPPPTPAPPSVKISPPPSAPPAVKDEFHDLTSKIAGHYERKISLLEMFKSGEISDKIFLKLYDEYAGKLNDLLSLKANRIEELRRDFDGKNKRIEDIKMTMEELDVRHKIGEVDNQVFNERTSMLKTEGTRLQTLVKELKINLEHLEKPLAEKTPRDVLDLDTKARSCYAVLGKLVEDGKLTSEASDKIKPDVEKMIGFFDSIIRERKEKERVLREQLETLQARYRLSEISIEEYEQKKRGIQDEIDKVWK